MQDIILYDLVKYSSTRFCIEKLSCVCVGWNTIIMDRLIDRNDKFMYMKNIKLLNLLFKQNIFTQNYTTFIDACDNGYANVVKLLLDNNHTLVKDGASIMCAMINRHKEVIELLIMNEKIIDIINVGIPDDKYENTHISTIKHAIRNNQSVVFTIRNLLKFILMGDPIDKSLKLIEMGFSY